MNKEYVKIFKIFLILFLSANSAGWVNYFIQRPKFFDSTFSQNKNPVIIISPQKAYQLFLKKIPFLDTRTEEEYNMAHIPGAILWDSIQEHPVNYLSSLKKDSIVLYCSQGCPSSKKVANFLASQSNKKFFVMFGGLEYWISEGFPYEK